MFDDFDEDDEFAAEDMEQEHQRIKNMPIFIKGREIYDLVRQITDLIPEEDTYLQDIKAMMLEDAAVLYIKVGGAEAAELYDLKMEAAAIIRKAAKSLMLSNHSLESFDFQHVEYFQMVRDLIEEYRLLFVDWVANFDKWHYIYDDWGLFNPPHAEQ